MGTGLALFETGDEGMSWVHMLVYIHTITHGKKRAEIIVNQQWFKFNHFNVYHSSIDIQGHWTLTFLTFLDMVRKWHA